MSSDTEMSPMPAPRYARFSRRLRAMLIDWIITLIVMFGAVLLAASVGNDKFSRGLGILAVAVLVFYEPILARACARVVIKGVLGLYSFVILAATRRNQAVHDLLTRSTVQIRDPAKASPGQYIAERTELAAAGLPSPLRRTVVTCAYLLLMAVIYLFIVGYVVAPVAISNACLEGNFCSGGERILSLIIGVGLLGLCAVCITLGWRGRLVGARATLAGIPVSPPRHDPDSAGA